MKHLIITACVCLALGALFVIALNSAGHVIKVDVVAPEEGYTAIQREQIESLMGKQK